MPKEIHRAVRSLDCIKFWKGMYIFIKSIVQLHTRLLIEINFNHLGLEFRTFLLYLGPVILKDFLPMDAYINYLYLFCAVRLCSTQKSMQHLNVAEAILKDYIEQYINLYGIDAIGSNVHNLCHLASDVRKFGPLPSISSYPFENKLYFIKNLLRHGNRPLAQVANRIVELENLMRTTNVEDERLNIKMNQKVRSVKLADGFESAANAKNKWFLTKSKDIVEMKYASRLEDGKIYICGSKIKEKKAFFTQPFTSTLIDIYCSFGSVYEPQLICCNEIECKMVSVKYNEQFIFLPLLHTVDLEIKDDII